MAGLCVSHWKMQKFLRDFILPVINYFPSKLFLAHCSPKLLKHLFKILKSSVKAAVTFWWPLYSFFRDDVNHAVTVVGYETSATGDEYWIVKNSWGDKWGDNGYFKIIKGKGHCSIGYNRNSVPFCQTSFTEKSTKTTM